MLLGQAVGSLGDITFSRVNGKQVIKSKPSVVKNPQTTSQLIQRILMNTVIQAYSKMAEICDHSFEGVGTGQDSMSYFMQRNLKNLRYQLAVTNDLDASSPLVCPLGVNGLASNDYIIAKGSLAEVTPSVNGVSIELALAGNTYQDVINAIGGKRGDQITLITVGGFQLNTQTFIYSRIILDPVDGTGESLPLSTAFISEGAIVSPNPRNENNGHEYSFEAGKFVIQPTNHLVCMGACIVSRQKSDGQWLRSNASLILDEGDVVGYTMQGALDMFAAGGIDVENPRYLNNAKRATARAQEVNGGGTSNGGGSSEEPTAPAAPTITVTGEGASRSVTMSAAQGASIYYTTDGTNPTSASTAYSSALTISSSCTVKAVAVKDGLTSEVASEVITIENEDDDLPGAGG